MGCFTKFIKHKKKIIWYNYMYVEEKIPVDIKKFIPLILIINIGMIVSLSMNYILTFAIGMGICLVILLCAIPELSFALFINAYYVILYWGETINQGHAAVLSLRVICLISLILYVLWNQVDFSFIRNPIYLSSILLGFLLFWGVLKTASPEYGLQKSINYVLTNIFLLTGLSILSQNPKRLKKLLIYLIAIGLFLTVSGLVKAFIIGTGKSIRLTVYDISSIWFSRILGFSFILLLSFINIKSRLFRSFIFAILFLFLVNMVFAGSRGPLVALFITLFLYFMIFSKISLSKKLLFISLILLFIAIAFLVTPERYTERYFDLGKAKDITSIMRKIMIRNIIPVFKKNFLLGIGTGGFSKIVTGGDIRVYPHNIFGELGLENGLIGIFTFTFFLIYNLIYSIHIISSKKVPSKIKNLIITSVLIISFSLLNAMVSGDVPVNEQIWIGSGIILGLYTIQRKQYQ